MPTIQLATRIKAPVQICFDLSRSIDLHKLAFADTDEQAIEGVKTGLIGQGETVTWLARHFGIYFKMQVKIIAMDAPNSFIDEMVKGPFRSMKHLHTFEAIDEGCVMRCHFQYQSPFGILGTLVDWLILTSYLARLLQKRDVMIRQIAECGDALTLHKYITTPSR